MLTHKICKGCNQKLEISRFSPCKNIKDGYENKCKSCRRNQRPKHSLTCKNCGEQFLSEKKESKFCSIKCNSESRIERISVPCSCCGEVLNRPPSLVEGFGNIYCNQKCRTIHLKEIMKGKGNPNYNRVKTNCGYCKKEIYEIPFKVNTQKYIYCSDECFREHRRILMTGELNPVYVRVTVNCDNCGKEFERIPSVAERHNKNYCSRECYEKVMIGFGEKRKNGKMYPCSICGKEIYASEWTRKTRKYFYCSTECKVKGWTKYFSGPDNPNWREEKPHEERVKERLLEGYKTWRKTVYDRDNYTCQCCGFDKGHKIVAHHKNGWDTFPEQRFDVNNGVTLCRSCHSEFHKVYKYGGNTEEQFNDWIKSRTVN